MSYEVSLDALGTSYSIPEAGQTNYANDLSLYLRDLATVVNDASGGSLVTPVFNVRTYGATGNGSTDDTVAINLAKAALLAASSTGGTLYFPAGTYKTSSTLQFGVSAAQSNVRIEGDGPNSIIKPTGSFSTTPVIEFRDCNYWVVTNIKIDASARTGSGDNILVDGCSYGYCTNSTIVNATRYGINITQVSGVSPSTYNVVNLNVFSGNTTANTNLTFTAPNVGSVVNNASGDVLVYAATDAFYDIRTYGAIPGAAGKTATTAAFNAIFAAISYSYFPTVVGKEAAVIYVPAVEDYGWYIGDLNPYVGAPGAGIWFQGDMESGRQGRSGSTIVYDGTLGGTMFDFQAINQSVIRNLTFDLGSKALVGLKLHQYWNVPNSSQVGSSGVLIENCFFHSPQGDYDSILVQAGSDDDNPNTLQSSEYRFRNCYFQGHNTIQGWGFRDVIGGNTKNFSFDNCSFGYLYRGIEARSGYLLCREVTGGNIGYDRDENACMIYAAGLVNDLRGCGLENGSVGYFARWLITTQGSHVSASACYIACTPPADDYVIDSGNAHIHLDCCDFAGSRTTASALPWTALTAVLEGQQRLNDGGKWYVCTQSGTTGNTGGPTGTGSAIADGSAEWDWVTSTEGNNAKLLLSGLLATSGTGQMGSAVVENCSFPYITTPLTSTPIYDGSNNPICPSIGGTFDYARSVNQVLYTRGNRAGLYGSDVDEFLPDNNGINIPNTRDQLWTDNLTSGCTVLRNDSGVYIATVPASTIAAQGAGSVSLGQMPAGYRITECLIDVTTLFSGPGVTGIEAAIGTELTADDSLLLSASIEATGQIGIDSVERGTIWDDGRYIIPFGTTPYLRLKCTVSGGSIASINAGSLNVYLQFQRLKT